MYKWIREASASRLSLWLTFAVSLVMFAWFQAAPALADPDGFYHVRLTTMLRDQGVVREFPWTQSSLYKDIFIDHHLGYHLLLMPFVSVLPNELVGAKVGTAVFAALTVLAAAWVMRRWRVPWWGIGVLLLLTAGPFNFRLSLVRAPSIGVGAAIIGYYLITERKLGWLFLWSWFFAWLYSAWPLLIVMALVSAAVESAGKLKQGWRAALAHAFHKSNWLLLGAVLGGSAAGLLSSPYFPTNLLYLKQLFTMALVSYHKFIGIGAEWYPYGATDLPADIAYPLLAWLGATAVAIAGLRRQGALSRTTWVMAAVFLLYTLRARRQVEYLTPWLVMSAGLILRDSVSVWSLAELRKRWGVFHSWLPEWLKGKFVLGFIAVYLAILVPWGLWRGVSRTYYEIRGSIPITHMAPAAVWLEKNTPPRSIVFQTDWGSFPELFFYNTHNYYLTGLDQTFMYEYNRDHFWQWVNVTTGKRHDVYEVARNTFGAAYLLLEKQYPDMLVWVNRDERFHRVYEDGAVIIYSLK